MKIERQITFTGKSIDEVEKALAKAKEFVIKKPEKKYHRYVYVSFKDSNKVSHDIFEGSNNIETVLKALDKGSNELKKIENFERYYINISITND